jgi:hypothetical protein
MNLITQLNCELLNKNKTKYSPTNHLHEAVYHNINDIANLLYIKCSTRL